MSASTALQAVRDHGRVTAGQQVLVIGASGGVGSFAVQIAKAFGAEVTGVARTDKLDLVRSLGADHVVDHTKVDVTAGAVRYDVVLDIGGNTPLRRLRRVLTPRGTLVIVGGEGKGRWLGIGRQLRAAVLSPFVGQKLGFFVNRENAADLVVLAGLIESGQVTPAVDRTFPLAEAAAAVNYMAEGQASGKVVVELPVVPEHRVLDPGRRAPGQDGPRCGVLEAGDGVRLEEVHPPVPAVRRRAADVQPPAPVGRVHEGRALQRLGAEGLLVHDGDRREADAVVGPGDHVGAAAPLADGAAQPVGQPPRRVDQLRRRGPDPGAGARVLRGDDHLGVVPERDGRRNARDERQMVG